MNSISIFEFDKIVAAETTLNAAQANPQDGEHTVPQQVFSWLEKQCLRNNDKTQSWLKLGLQNGKRALQFNAYVGIVQAPGGFQIEVLPKTGKNSNLEEARACLIKMLQCLPGFRHIQTAHADLAVRKMPLLELFIQQFLLAVDTLRKQGLRGAYETRQDNLFALRGKLLISRQIAENLVRRDRFFTEHDEFSQNRAENRLIQSALARVLEVSVSHDNQRSARELSFAFAHIPASTDFQQDIQKIRLDRGMAYYATALEWAKLILLGLSPVNGIGQQHAPSLLFPMHAIFEAYVAKHLARQLQPDFSLQKQASWRYLIRHCNENLFRLKPDLLILAADKTAMVLDTKWKLIENSQGSKKYHPSQADMYQMHSYGHSYLNGKGDMVLIYPKTDAFSSVPAVFEFEHPSELRLWVLPFCLKCDRLVLPPSPAVPISFTKVFLEACHCLTP